MNGCDRKCPFLFYHRPFFDLKLELCALTDLMLTDWDRAVSSQEPVCELLLSDGAAGWKSISLRGNVFRLIAPHAERAMIAQLHNAGAASRSFSVWISFAFLSY